MTLRRVADATQFGLPIKAVLCAAGLSSDGRSSSANVPQTHGQLISLERCYAKYDVDPASISAIEGHGTSTPVGDSTELKTLYDFFAGHVPSPVPVHSLKGLLGHAGWAAGTASLIAACEYLRCGIFPAQANLNQRSETACQSSDVLAVLDQPKSLPDVNARIAIDGFGFGGANAHLVIEAFETSAHYGKPRNCAETDLVFVGCEQIRPTVEGLGGRRFDREAVKLPDGVRVLPDLVDDMDITQMLATKLTMNVIDTLANFQDDLRRDTSIVLAMRGKTERGVEATLRVMAPRFRRQLEGNSTIFAALDAAHQRARPSRGYTLQCMMPNVASGRAALLSNLNGPNFVVDAGEDSLGQAITAAELLLRGGDAGGTRLAIVGAIHANSRCDPYGMPAGQNSELASEFAAAFAITTRGLAEQIGWPIMGTVGTREKTAGSNFQDQVQSLIARLHAKPTSSTAIENALVKDPVTKDPVTKDPVVKTPFQMHTPVWVEKALSPQTEDSDGSPVSSLLIVVAAETELVSQLLAAAPAHADEVLIAVVGPGAEFVTAALRGKNCIAVPTMEGRGCREVIERIRRSRPAVIVAVQTTPQWDVMQTLDRVADRNEVCEFLFVLAQDNVERLTNGHLQLWSLVLGGWNDEVHPASGAVAGLLKSIEREIPASRSCSLCTRDANPSAALQKMFRERQETDFEKEVVYDGPVRMVRRLRPVRLSSDTAPQVRLDSTSVIIASGGARGVTAVMLEAIVRDYQCTVIALGRSALVESPDDPASGDVEQAYYRRLADENPGMAISEMKSRFESVRASWEASRTIESLDRIGGRVHYMAVDVTDEHQVAAALREIHREYGRVDLLIHGAGVQVSKRLKDRSIREFRNTFSVKVVGLRNLVRACQNEFGEIVPVHALTSAYSLFGNDGQPDYGAANETLDRLCALASPDLDVSHSASTRWTSLAWLAWDGIGMTRGTEYRALAKQRSLSGMDPETGQRLFRDVIEGRTAVSINVPLTESEHVRYLVDTVPAPTNSATGRVIEVRTRLSEIPCLPFHLVRGVPTLPGAWIVERLVSAAVRLYPDPESLTTVTVDNLSFKRFVRSPKQQSVTVRVIVEQTDLSISGWMMMDIVHSSGRVLHKDVVCASATFTFDASNDEGSGPFHPSIIQPPPLLAASPNRQNVMDPYCRDDQSIVALSGAFDCLRDIVIHDDGRHAVTRHENTDMWSGSIPSLLLDAAWRVGAMYTSSDKKSLFVPVKIGRLRLPIANEVRAIESGQWHIRSSNPRIADGGAIWDQTEVTDPTGTVRIVVENAFAKRIE